MFPHGGNPFDFNPRRGFGGMPPARPPFPGFPGADPADHLRDALAAHGDYGPRGRHGGRRGGGRSGHGRQRRGDVRAAILALLTEGPMHGYEMIKEIGRRSGGFWRPSPGSVYPTLQLLADEGLVESEDSSGGRKLFSLTAEGVAEAEKGQETPPWDEVKDDVDPHQVALRQQMGRLMAAATQISIAAADADQERAVKVLSDTTAKLYGILAEPTSSDDADGRPDEAAEAE